MPVTLPPTVMFVALQGRLRRIGERLNVAASPFWLAQYVSFNALLLACYDGAIHNALDDVQYAKDVVEYNTRCTRLCRLCEEARRTIKPVTALFQDASLVEVLNQNEYKELCTSWVNLSQQLEMVERVPGT